MKIGWKQDTLEIKLTNLQKESFKDKEDLFSKLKNPDWISKEFFDKQLKNFLDREWEIGKQIFDNVLLFLRKNDLYDVKTVIAATYLISKLVNLKWKDIAHTKNWLKLKSTKANRWNKWDTKWDRKARGWKSKVSGKPSSKKRKNN